MKYLISLILLMGLAAPAMAVPQYDVEYVIRDPNANSSFWRLYTDPTGKRVLVWVISTKPVKRTKLNNDLMVPPSPPKKKKTRAKQRVQTAPITIHNPYVKD